ncbi:CDP-alcohol phosphatidyltransferase family protein [Catellatospora chokoriensis]|uniref:CDP-alcohol phosphatidyltransferase family protein n=1 Tax=Catellatospora chokoriensis TaxID=310353 RepID=UPI001EF1DA73|nr:CDP-alcohol phosphatidyltransferase family protein [Catellatospora chokoriensis]
MRPGPVIGLLLQFAMLALLSAAVGLGRAGWAAGAAYALGSGVLLTRAMHTAGLVAFGPADLVTQTRAALVGCVTALTAASFAGDAPVPALVGITVVALVLDAVDGKVARRTATASAFGARFDMEVDAFLILVLSCYVAPSAGLWVLAIGAMRYVYVVATWVLPWLRGQLFPRYWRKVVAAIQGIVLVTAAADVLPRPVAVVALAGALALLTESFGRDVVFLWRHRAATIGAIRRAAAQAPAMAGAPGAGGVRGERA